MSPKIIQIQIVLIIALVGMQFFGKTNPIALLCVLTVTYILTLKSHRYLSITILCAVFAFAPRGSEVRHKLSDFELLGTIVDGPLFQPGGCRYVIRSGDTDWAIWSTSCDALPDQRIEAFVRPSNTRPFAGRALDFYPQTNDVPFTLKRSIAKSRTNWIRKTAQIDHRGLTLALTTGNKAFLEPKTTDLFRDLGISHLLAISGLHFGIIAALLWFIIGRIIDRFPSLILRFGKKKILGPFVIFGLYVFLLFVGSPISAIRAFIMVSAYIIGTILSRHTRPCISVLYALCALLIYDPSSLENLGFQLSFCAVIGILSVLNNSKLINYLAQDSRLRHQFFSLVFVSVSAGLSTLPVLLHHSGQISWIAFPLNVIAVPIFSTVIFPVVLFAAFLFRFGGPFEFIGEHLLNLVTNLTLLLVDTFSFLPFLSGARSFPGSIPAPVTFLLFLGIIYALHNLEKLRIFSILALVITSVGLVYCFSPEDPNGLRIHFIDVGQGDSIFIETPKGKKILVDTGGTMFGADPGQRIVAPYLKRIGNGVIDTILITHNDQDHNGGLPAIRRTISTERVIRTLDESAYLKELGFEIFQYKAKSASKNNQSLVLKIRFGKSCIILSGDIEEEAEVELAGKLSKCAVLKLAHHGSKTSTSDYFLDRIDPAFAIISAGRNNHFGHPHISVVERLRERGIRIFSTQTHGSIVLDFDEKGVIIFSSERDGLFDL